MSDLMRLDFEKAMAEMLTKDTDAELTAMDLMDCRDGDEYKSHVLSSAWWAWQASRECLVIELPERIPKDNQGDYWTGAANGFNQAIDTCAIRIKQSGIKVKS